MKDDLPKEWTSQYTSVAYDMSKEVDTFESLVPLKPEVVEEDVEEEVEETEEDIEEERYNLSR